MAGRRYPNYDDWYLYEPTRPIRTDQGIKARSQRGAFAKNWWALRWLKAIEEIVESGRLGRGRSYARQGQVLSIDEIPGAVQARVQGSRRTPYNVTIKLKPLTDSQWEQVIDALASQAIFSAELLAGEMPQNIEQAFAAAGVSLFPDKRGDLITDCSCPDPANPCKHIAATHYILGDRFDEDPFLLFRLRGRTQEQVLAGMRARRAGVEEVGREDADDDEAEESVALEETLDRFWEMAEPLEPFPVTVRPPQVTLPLLKRLDDPSFLPEGSLQTYLGPAYEAMTRQAMVTAASEAPESEQQGEGLRGE